MTQSSENSKKRNVPLTPFRPPIGLRNAHFQTVLSSVGPRRLARAHRFKPYLTTQRALILNGGDGVRLEGYYNKAYNKANGTNDGAMGSAQASTSQSDELVIMIHGWEGSHDSTYMKSMAGSLLHAGLDTFRLNLRDHGQTHHLNKGVFNSTLIDEVVNAIEDLQARLNYKRYTLIGFSLGGNFSLRVAANAHGRAISLEQVIAFCPVVHAEQSNNVLNERRNRLYGRYFVKKWRRSLHKKLEHWPQYTFAEQLTKLKTLDEMNQAFIPQYTNFKEVGAYFDDYAIDGKKLADTICPCYLHFAKDDMIIPVAGVDLLARNSDLHVTITERGGHCGFIMNWRGDSWQDVRALEIIQSRTN